ncbi:MAG: molybdopterin-dependent oxidoreductase [Planctomycetes bacterium]|nr:molybdopterin-dependent oxidoreductase [Planctomycetota bacterium]
MSDSHHPRPAAPLRVVGTPRVKVDARAKCTGETRFADDLFFPRMACGRLLRSTEAHALIRSIDVSAAVAMEGVYAVLTGKDLPIPFGILPVSEDEHALCPEHVRFVGDPVAAVAARDPWIAEAAVNAIKVDYEPLPVIGSIEEAIARPTPQIHPYADEGNLHRKLALEFGDVARGLAEADLVREDLFFYEGNTHLPIEQHACVALADADGKLTLYSSTQTPHYVHKALAKTLALPPAHIRVIALPNGGGFGGKSDPFNHEIVAAKLALVTRRPVKITLNREEVFYCHRGRHPVLLSVKTGVRRDGAITGMHFRCFLDGGAYGSYGVASTYYTGALQTVTYKVKNYKFDGIRAFTNKPPCGPKRGHGTPQPRCLLEVHLDKIAGELALDPIEMRLRHLVEPNSVTANYLTVGSSGLRACIEKVRDESKWGERRGRLGPGRGLGFAAASYLSGAGLPIYWNNLPHSGVQLKLDRGGGVCVFCGSTDIGQGSDSVLAYVVAEVLGIEPLDIRVVTADTDLTPVDLGSYSSRVTLMTGNAALQAAERARELLTQAVGAKLGLPADRIGLGGRRAFDTANPEIGMSFAEAVQCAEAKFGTIGTVGSYSPPASKAKYRGGGVGPSPAYSYSAMVAEVEVDATTGWVKVPRLWIAHDCGKAINPLLVIGQVEGGVYMGLGEVLMEGSFFRGKLGVHKVPSLLEYKSPTTLETPEMFTYLIEDPDPNGPYGAKEAGQGPLLPVMPAVLNAVYDAVGVRIDETPIHPHRVLEALKRKAEGKEARVGPTALPKLEYAAPVRVPTPWEGGDGRAVAGEPVGHKKKPAEAAR